MRRLRDISCISFRSRTGTDRCGRPSARPAGRSAPRRHRPHAAASAATASGCGAGDERGAAPKIPPGSAFGSFRISGGAGAALRPRRGRALVDVDPHQPQRPDHFLVDPALHVLEHLVAFALVFDERVFLPVAAKPDAFLQVVQAVEMILPLRVDDLQHELPLDVSQNLRSERLFLRLVLRRDARPRARSLISSALLSLKSSRA